MTAINTQHVNKFSELKHEDSEQHLMQKIKYISNTIFKKFCTEIFGLTTTLEKPTRGKPVREGFLLFRASEKNSFTTDSSSKNYTNLSQNFFSKTPSEQPQNCSSISVPEIRTSV
jgi:hypothetical protein